MNLNSIPERVTGANGYAAESHALKHTHCRNDPLTTAALEIKVCGMRRKTKRRARAGKAKALLAVARRSAAKR